MGVFPLSVKAIDVGARLVNVAYNWSVSSRHSQIVEVFETRLFTTWHTDSLAG